MPPEGMGMPVLSPTGGREDREVSISFDILLNCVWGRGCSFGWREGMWGMEGTKGGGEREKPK